MTRWDMEWPRSAQAEKPEANQITSLVGGKISIRNGSQPMPEWNSGVDGERLRRIQCWTLDGIDEAREGRKDLEWLTDGFDRCSELLNVGLTNLSKES